MKVFEPEPASIEVEAPGGSYTIALGPGQLERLGVWLERWGLPAGALAVVAEPKLQVLYGKQVLSALSEAGYEPHLCEVPGGEANKTLATVASLYERFSALGLDRRAPILALGGGVTGDLAGFAAASWLRGVPFVQVPTSLLAMVDSSVGGKTGVDLPQGKNLVGAFKQPAGVLIDPRVLRTLPDAEVRAGLAEVLKHGLIGDPALFARLEQGVEGLDELGWSELVHDAVRVKVEVVAEDPFERGRRAVLNLGHTFGHAFELLSGFALRHGEAVGVGLIAAADLAERLGRAEAGLSARVEAALATLGLPTRLSFEVDAARAAMRADKKKRGRTLRFVIPRAVGVVELIDDPGAPVEAALARVRA